MYAVRMANAGQSGHLIKVGTGVSGSPSPRYTGNTCGRSAAGIAGIADFARLAPLGIRGSVRGTVRASGVLAQVLSHLRGWLQAVRVRCLACVASDRERAAAVVVLGAPACFT